MHEQSFSQVVRILWLISYTAEGIALSQQHTARVGDRRLCAAPRSLGELNLDATCCSTVYYLTKPSCGKVPAHLAYGCRKPPCDRLPLGIHTVTTHVYCSRAPLNLTISSSIFIFATSLTTVRRKESKECRFHRYIQTGH